MLRTLFIWFIVLVVTSTGLYFYQTRQINNTLDEMSRMAAPFGRLEHGGASFSLTGEARINQLRFRPHGSHEDIRVNRIAITTGSLLNLMQLDRTLNDGRLPTQLGISLRGVRFPLDGPLFAAMEEGGGVSVLPFDAAGCGARDYFTGRDLAGMNYLDFTGGMDIEYRLVGDVDAIEWSMEIIGDGMNRMRFGTSIGIDARSNAVQDIAMASESIALRSISFEFEDLGYYPRMMEFCADEMEMSAEEYIEHHLDRWQAQWLEEGMTVGPSLVENYRQFLEDPGRVSGQIIPTGNVFGLLERGVSPSRLLGSVSVTLSINDEPSGPLDLRYATPEDRQAASDATRSRRTEERDEAETVSDAAGDDVEATGWKPVAAANLGRHEGAQVRIVLGDGRERSGQLIAVGNDEIIIERRMRGGYMEVPIRRSRIAEVQVWY